MTALVPDCDPDLSRSPVWCTPGDRPAPPRGVRSTLVLLGLLLATAFLAAGGAAPLWIAVPAGAVALLAAWALVRRAVQGMRAALQR
jgi:hypothetical protein